MLGLHFNIFLCVNIMWEKIMKQQQGGYCRNELKEAKNEKNWGQGLKILHLKILT